MDKRISKSLEFDSILYFVELSIGVSFAIMQHKILNAVQKRGLRSDALHVM